MSRLREAWAQGRTAFGAWVMLTGPAAIEMIAMADFDYVCVDLQHGLLDYSDMRDSLLTLNGHEVSPIVRVPRNDPADIGKALDAGAEGVIIPLVNSVEDAKRAADACLYPPEGSRSFGPARAFQAFRGTKGANEGVVCLPMIETKSALDAADEICAVDGVTGIYIGPSDLGLSLGVEQFSTEHEAAVTKIRKACTSAGIVPCIHALDGATAKVRADSGFRMVTVVSDGTMIAKSCAAELAAARS